MPTISTASYPLRGGMWMERMVRPFDGAQRVLQRAIDSRPPERDNSDTDIRWGAASRFEISHPEQPTNPSVVVGGGSTGPDEEPATPPGILVFTEVEKYVEEVRIENPEDPEQYVDTTRRVWSLFLGPDGLYRQFVWDNSDL